MMSALPKLGAAIALILGAIFLDITSVYSPFQIPQLLLSFALAVGGALVAIRGLVEFLSERFQ
jgi:undecaprenyl pyrophosphate phosphatase UppP